MTTPPPPGPAESKLSDLTLAEKVSLLEGHHSWRTQPIDRLGIPSLFLTDGPHGVRKVRDAEGAFNISDNAIAASFPTASAVAASWDPDNARRIGEAIGREAAAMDVDVLLAPGVNIIRDPRLGRTFEYFSEDPLLSGVFGSAFVDGVQSQGVGASVKHLAANSNEEYRFVGDSVVDERALREIYLRAFERIVTQTSPATVMCAYNQLNGTYCSENAALLTDILRDEWGFDGLVMSDWGATHDRVAGVRAGLDLDMPGSIPHNRTSLLRAVKDGTLAVADIDAAARRVLRLVDRSRSVARPETPPDPAEQAAVARSVAADAAVLLTNDGTLPLAPATTRITVVGEMFERLRFQGAGSSMVTPASVTSAQDAFAARGIAHRYARGYRSLSLDRDSALEREAVAAARDAEVVLFFGGLSDLEESEGFDRTDLHLGEAQTALLEALLDVGTPVVLVLHAGAPVAVPFVDRLAAILHMHLPGMQGGEATADLLFGDVNPSGRLTHSWPRQLSDVAAFDDFNRGTVARYYESIYVGYRFHDAAGTDLLFPFGHGLSYTTFAWSDLRVAVTDGQVTATLSVRNTGERAGSDVIQVYVENNHGATFKAAKELRGFAKVHLDAGASTDVRVTFPLADLAYWDVALHAWVVENGDYAVLAAASASDIRLRAPLRVTSGRESRSPYPAAVDRDYATPPRRVPASFPALLGRAVPAPAQEGRLTMETRLADARGSLIGGLLYRIVVGHLRSVYAKALAEPESLDRDTRVKHAHFTYRLMPTNSLRSMAMASGGMLPYRVAAAISALATGHPWRAVRTLVTGR